MDSSKLVDFEHSCFLKDVKTCYWNSAQSISSLITSLQKLTSGRQCSDHAVNLHITHMSAKASHHEYSVPLA
eukprot:5512269-Ditylum_brightwellii.AAC.1